MRRRKRTPAEKAERERRIQATLRKAMKEARSDSPKAGKQKTSRKASPSGSAMAQALVSAGLIKAKSGESSKIDVRDGKGLATKSSKKPAQNGQSSKQKRPRSRALRKTKSPEQRAQEAKAREKLERKKRERLARKLAAIERARRREEEGRKADLARRKAEREKALQGYLRQASSLSFTMLLSGWKKYVGLLDYYQRTGKNPQRAELYAEVVAAVEREWQRRAKLPHTSDEYFDWPSTKAGKGKGGLSSDHWVDQGVLGYLGYSVGEKSDLTQSERHAILRRVFEMHLPPIESPTYMKQWGRPASASRLRKMANSLASFARQAKRRRSTNMQEAINSWEHDLDMLYREYYQAKFGFGWPPV
ncbi:hypothetical protein [Sphingomicrobium lutaoense]|uniref:Uncharacterized protein n=1 Tax=Sphingomicrobium lutaoense TaxID=515949 RepID=A0A839YYN9_9SPHN|nr:hypothetical protein [Sphingomicrobium lutaoense]MBB3763438.1 hypothetical protein [Sphingomicrobium lutaoense]